MTTQETATRRLSIDWVNTLFLAGAHAAAIAGIVYLCLAFSWWTLALGIVWYAFCGISITGGYHRLFAHPTYRANRALQLFYLCFGAASVQNSALKWSADHRQHHSGTDTDADPYNIRRGFWWAHMGWVLFKDKEAVPISRVPDLQKNPLVMFQDRYYIPLAIFFGAILPAIISGVLWGDWVGGVLVAGFLRLVLQYHATFSINSLAHYLGKQPYSDKDSARDSWVTALITMGEGYHNYHHSFPADYRNGVRAWQFDPTKWLVFTLSKVGVTRELKRVPKAKILDARRRERERRMAA